MGKNKAGGMSTGKKAALIIVAVIFALILGGGLYAYSYIQNTMNKMDKVDISDNAQDLGITENKNGEIVNIALYGIDAAEGETGRSDSIMILTLDNVHNRIKLTSVMRDSYVDIAGHGMDKINHAYAFGGLKSSICSAASALTSLTKKSRPARFQDFTSPVLSF